MALIVPPKVSSHLAVVDFMQEAPSLTTQGAGSVVLLLPQLQIGIMWKRVMCSIKGNFMVLDGKAWTAFAHKVAVPEVVVYGASLLVSGGLAPAVAYQHLLDFLTFLFAAAPNAFLL